MRLNGQIDIITDVVSDECPCILQTSKNIFCPGQLPKNLQLKHLVLYFYQD